MVIFPSPKIQFHSHHVPSFPLPAANPSTDSYTPFKIPPPIVVVVTSTLASHFTLRRCWCGVCVFCSSSSAQAKGNFQQVFFSSFPCRKKEAKLNSPRVVRGVAFSFFAAVSVVSHFRFEWRFFPRALRKMVNNDKKDAVVEDENTIADNTVVQKYKVAGNIVNSEYPARRPWRVSVPWGGQGGVYFWDVAFSLALPRLRVGCMSETGRRLQQEPRFWKFWQVLDLWGPCDPGSFWNRVGKDASKICNIYDHCKS